MIGKVIIGTSFKNCLDYCLSDKHKLSPEQKQMLSELEQVQHRNRAEVLAYNKCFGNAKELANDFEEVKKLSSRIEKPVLHITLRLAPGDRPLSKNDLTEIGNKCAKEFGVADHQYVSILHKDTQQQHIHLVANRVGLDGKVASDSNNYRRMATFCRSIEKEYHLTEVLSPRAFLSKEERNVPRHDRRKEKLKNDIARLLKDERINTYGQFEQHMKMLGYRIEKGRGICFIDDKNVRTKGSEVGFSWMKIEKVLSLKSEITGKENAMRILAKYHELNRRQELKPYREEANGKQSSIVDALKVEVKNIIHQIMQPAPSGYTGAPLPPKKKKRRKPNW